MKKWAIGVLVAIMVAPALVACSSNTNEQRQVVVVPTDAETISDAVKKVAPGGLVLIEEGTYYESVTVSTPGITIRGAERNNVVIDAEGVRPYGIVVMADGVTVENLTVQSATFYGVLVTGVHDENGPRAHNASGYETFDPELFPPIDRFRVNYVTAANNGLYGIYAFNAQHGVIENSYASGSADSGFYVGQCRNCDIVLQGNVAERNAVGFENANASDSLSVVGNRFSDNRVGVTVISNYQEAMSPQRGMTVAGNLVRDNDTADSPSHAEGGYATGVAISGGRDNVISHNRISGHQRAAFVLANTEDMPAYGNRMVSNVLEGNAADLANVSAERAPAESNCAEVVVTLPASIADLLNAACAGSGGVLESISMRDLPEIAIPRGLSFLDVPLPKAQPTLPRDVSVPAPLPATVSHPAPDSWSVPAADYLVERTGTR